MSVTPAGSFYFAKSVNEAILVAEQLKDQGDYDLFRGQILNFPVHPSIFRFGVDRELAKSRLNKFANWIHADSELSSLHNNRDAILAVAHHYGLKTPLLDFTTNPRVAGFFATDGPCPNEKTWDPQGSCIICVNRSAFIESWRDINEKSKKNKNLELVRIVEIDVHNLWRLQAQEGLFIEAHVDQTTFEALSLFFRIMFKFNGPLKSVKKENIYPDRRSHLELRLEEYFNLERHNYGITNLENIGFTRISPGEQNFIGDLTAFRSGLPQVHPSWDIEKLMPWRKEPKEVHSEVRSNKSIRIRFRETETISDCCSRIRKQVLRAFQRNSNLRTILVRWSILNSDGKPLTVDDESKEPLDDETFHQIRCEALVSLLWDGIRLLPYSDDQASACIANYLCLAKFGRKALNELFQKTIGVEFSAAAARGRGIASEEGLLRSIRQDFKNLLKPDEINRIEKSHSPAREALGIIVNPSRLFEFSTFSDVFIRTVIPTQLWIRLQSNMLIFSPARLEVFGND